MSDDKWRPNPSDLTVSNARPLLRGYLLAGAALVAALGGTYRRAFAYAKAEGRRD